jgi:CubicO group peptidase (beta-lactamase class C family)
MCVIRGQSIQFERYAQDFGPDQPHSIQSITKTMMNLIIGGLVESGALDLSRPVSHYIPEIGSGYAQATVQQVLNMDVVNDYSEDFTHAHATYYTHEEAMGWRLPQIPGDELTQRQFLPRIKSTDTINHGGRIQYKDANTAVLGWVAERASGRPLRSFVADIVDAAGLEGSLYITTDREAFPTFEGGACMTARDLARYFSLFVRRGRGVDNRCVGSDAFIARTLVSGIPLPPPYEGVRYSNHARVTGRALGHTGWGGQCALANLETGMVAVFFSVTENEHAIDPGYLKRVFDLLVAITDL